MRDAHVRAVVDSAIHGRWSEAKMLRELVIILAHAKAEYERMATKLAASQVSPIVISGTIPGPGDSGADS